MPKQLCVLRGLGPSADRWTPHTNLCVLPTHLKYTYTHAQLLQLRFKQTKRYFNFVYDVYILQVNKTSKQKEGGRKKR